MTVRMRDLTVEWLGYATARLQRGAGPVVYTDPGRYGVLDGHRPEDGDLVVVTHDHHYDSDAIRRVAASNATVVVFDAVDAAGIERDIEPVDDLPYEIVRIGEGETFEGRSSVTVRTTPAYNRLDGPAADPDGSVSHPRGFGCGYLLTIDDTEIFWPGDTDALPTFHEYDVDILLANIGGSVVMDADAAASLAATLEPDLVVPIHYDTIELLAADDTTFAADVASAGIPVALDRPTR